MGVEREVDVATYTRDVRRKPGDSKMPSMKPVYLYPEAPARFPGLPSQSVSSIEQTCQLKYRAMRYNVIWTSAVALPVFRYPTPFPTHNQSWSVAMENDAPIVSLRIGSVRYRLRLKTGAQFHRQFIAVRQLVAGAAKKGEMAIYQRGDALMVKMVAWLPRKALVNKGAVPSTLFVRTGEDCLLIPDYRNGPRPVRRRKLATAASREAIVKASFIAPMSACAFPGARTPAGAWIGARRRRQPAPNAPVIEEVLELRVSPDYFQYLRYKLEHISRPR